MRTEAQKRASEKYKKSEKGKLAVKKSNRKCAMFHRLKLRIKIIDMLGGKCANPYDVPHPDWCNDQRCLQIDHVNGGGTKMRRIIKNYDEYYRKIIEEIKAGSKNYQLLCANCNWIKKDINKEQNNHNA